VVECVQAMRAVTTLPVTVKTRIGIDHQDSYQFLCDFIGQVAQQGGCDTFIIHARKAWLSGLSPKENREIPPLDYQRVYQLKQDFPHLTIAINGGIQTLQEALTHLHYVDGVMMGRAAYQNPSLLLGVDPLLFGSEAPATDSQAAVEALYPYIEQQLTEGGNLNHITRHILGLFQGQPGARQWRRYLSENAHNRGAGVEVVRQALQYVISG
ncbi:MAG: tRNA dihydrouridine(20/20a) synthase DusA, partial [Enterobacteriaceae bacterium]